MACARLHNFCVNERLARNGTDNSTVLLQHMFTHKGQKYGYILSDTREIPRGEDGTRNQIIKDRIAGRALTRPSWNTLRNGHIYLNE